MSYLHSTKHAISRGYVGNNIEECHIGLFCDADFAGDTEDSKSVTGVLVAIVGSHTFRPIAFRRKKQDCVSKSTTEAEVVAMCQGLQYEGIPMLDIWDVLCPGHEQRATRVAGGKGTPPFVVYEDNQSAITVAETGNSNTMRHAQKTHRVNVAWLHEIVNMPLCSVMYVPTLRQAADIFTKGFDKPRPLLALRLLVGVHDPGDPPNLVIPFTDRVTRSRLSFKQKACCVGPSCCIAMPMPKQKGVARRRGEKSLLATGSSIGMQRADYFEVETLDS